METNKKSSVVKFDFQHGFANDTIILKVNGKEVLKKDGISSDLRISLAGSFTLDVPNGQINLEIIVPTKNLSSSQTIMIDSEGKYVGISIINSETKNPRLKITELNEQPFYL
jgi:hypothetical protein